MSSRALRKLHGASNGDVARANTDEESEEDSIIPPSRTSRPVNAFALLGVEDNDGGGEEEEVVEESAKQEGSLPAKRNKKKKKKKKGKSSDQGANTSQTEQSKPVDEDEVERSIREVNEMLGSYTIAAPSSATASHLPTLETRGLLCVEHRYLNADNEMRRIFGSRVVRADKARRRAHNSTYHRASGLVAPRDSWPPFSKVGIAMELDEKTDRCHRFRIEHSPAYQQIQIMFWDSVESMDPEAIAAVLRQHPYHIDSLLQLAEICKMSEDRQAAAELIERALYALESCFHTRFNVAVGTNRLDFCKTENRAFFLTIFRHLVMVGLRGCYRTSLEFCKLLLSLDPDDPLGVLLMIDFYALRSAQYAFLIRLFDEWESHRQLSQLPNFAFSVPLAMFHASGSGSQDDEHLANRANRLLKAALIQFPSVLLPMMERCSVAMPPEISTHKYFVVEGPSSEQPALKQLVSLYIERTNSVWKEPEVLTWLETTCRAALKDVDNKVPAVATCRAARMSRYQGTPRNVHRHILVSDLPNVAAMLPVELSNTAIMMYDPLPPDNAYASYSRPERRTVAGTSRASLLSLFLQSIAPSYNPQAAAGTGAGQNAEGLQLAAEAVAAAAQGEGLAEGGVANALQNLLAALRLQLGLGPDNEDDEEDEDGLEDVAIPDDINNYDLGNLEFD